MLRTPHVKQVWNRWVDRLHAIKTRVQNKDDTVEAQAETFRIWMWSSAAGLSLIIITAVVSMSRGDDTVKPAAAEQSMLEKLPDGFMIAPIDPINIDSLDSIFEQHGYADLYRADGEKGKGQRIARGLPLIRAPRNPRRFAVLVREEQSSVLASLNEPVLVILRKKPPKGFAQVEPPGKKKRRGSIRGSTHEYEAGPGLGIIEEDIPELRKAETHSLSDLGASS